MQKKTITVGDIMTKKVVTAFRNERVVDVARRIFDHDFNGLPVIDINKEVVGIITQYDLLNKGTRIHIPTFIKLLKKMPILRQEKSLFKKEIKPILDLKVKDLMNKEPLMVRSDEGVDSVINIFAEHHKVNPIPVVNQKRELVGIISRHDVVKFLAGPKRAEWKKPENSIDIQIGDFIDNFQKKFIIARKSEASEGLFLTIIFYILGFWAAFYLVYRFLF